jgi:SPP1 family phage portal protein
MNILKFSDIIKGAYGRKVAKADVERVDSSNVLDVLSSTVGVFNLNRIAIKYLWDYYKGDQPIRYRKKVVRDDLKPNNIVENHAYEIVMYKNAQTNDEPIQCVALKDSEEINKAVERLNEYNSIINKYTKDINSGEWTSAVGTGFKAVQRTGKEDKPYRIVTPSPMNTYIVYSSITEEALMSVQELKDVKGNQYYHIYTPSHEFKVSKGKIVDSKLHAFGGIPIIEYPNNQSRLSDIEIVIDILDAINNMQSNRVDAVEQFVQSFMKFVNCQIDEEQFKRMKEMGAIVVKSNNGDNKADVDILTQELNQGESQVTKKDLIDSTWSILAIPNREGNTGGDTQGAVQLRNGHDFSKQRAKIKDSQIKCSEKELMSRIINIIRIDGKGDVNLTDFDYDVQISHSPTDNILVKVQALQLMLTAGIHPLIAIKTAGLWSDCEKVFMLSKPYLDALYQTLDQIQDREEQELKAQEIMAKVGSGKDDNKQE